MGQFDQLRVERPEGIKILENTYSKKDETVVLNTEDIQVKEDVKSQRKLDDSKKIKELEQELIGKEELNEEESRILQIGVNLHKAMKEEEDATKELLARGMAGSDVYNHYADKWKNLNNQFNEELEKNPESREKINEKLRLEIKKLGLEKNAFGEYIKPQQN
jgi:hypothetical protein